MFGKKKQGEATSEKPAKKKKAKKSKGKSTEGQSRFGDGGIKLMLAKNIEKIGLAAVVATALYVVFSSYKTPGLAESKQPSQLVTAISNAERNIDSASWDQEAQSRYLSPDNYEAKATEDVAPVNPMDYPLTQPLEPVKHGLPKLRSDVELLALEDLEVITGFGPIAIPPKQIAQTARLGEERQTYDEADERVLRDLPDEVAGMMGKTFSAPPESKLEARQFVCVTGLIPLKKQYEKYRKAFQDANGYNFERDFPVYTREFRVERAEVGSDGQLAPYVLIWGAESGKKRSPQEKKLRRELAKYCFKLPMEETVRQDALDPARMWSHPLPALTHRDLSAFKHSKIETQMDLEQKMLTQDMNMNSQTAGDPFARPTGMQGGYGGSSDGGGYSSGYGGGGGGYGSAYGGGGGGYGSAYGGGGGGGYGSAYGGGGAAPGSGYGGGGYGGGGYGGRGGSSSDGGGGYGGGGYGGGGGGQVTFDENDNAILSIDEKMFRFFDFTAMPGKAYRYRVQLALEDPNYPLDPSMAPRAKHIDANVTARLTHQAEAKPEGVDRIYWRLAEWSAPSPMVSLGRTERILAGEVKPALKGRATVNGKSVFFPKASSDKPQISAIVVGFDKEHNGDIPGTATLRLGSVANFRGSKVEMVDPKLMMLRMKDKHEFRSDMLVLDIIGGDELPSRKGETKLKAPGEMLVFTSSGQLEVHSEIEESSQFSYNTFPAADPTNSPYGDAYGSDDDDKKNRRRRGRGRGGYGGGGY